MVENITGQNALDRQLFKFFGVESDMLSEYHGSERVGSAVVQILRGRVGYG